MASNLITPEVSFANMSWNPDVPAHMLAANEYSGGKNIETDVRTLRKVYGEEELFAKIPGTPVYGLAVNRTANIYVFIVGTREGKWWQIDANGVTNITPGYSLNPDVALTGYTDSINITDSEVGGVVFLNDGLRPPMFYRPTDTEIQIYDIDPAFKWNYEGGIGVLAVTAGFVRAYASPHGNVLVAGNLTKTFAGGVTQKYQATLRWSNLFALGSVPDSWDITNATFGNEVDLPVRGPLIDGFHFGGNFYAASYWDTACIYPIAYQTTLDSIFGQRLINTGRGLISNNSWSNTDEKVYGLDSRDVWEFNGQEFKSLGNQKVKEYFYANISPGLVGRTFMINNTRKNSIEIYFPDLTSTSWNNQMISYRYDLQVWNPPRDVANAVIAMEGPLRIGDQWVEAERAVYYLRGGDEASNNSQVIRKDVPGSYSFVNPADGSYIPINAYFEKTQIHLPDVPYWQKMLFHRFFPMIEGQGTLNFELGGSQAVGISPIYTQPREYTIGTQNPWVQAGQNEVRTLAIRFNSDYRCNSWSLGSAALQITKATEDY